MKEQKLVPPTFQDSPSGLNVSNIMSSVSSMFSRFLSSPKPKPKHGKKEF